MKLIRFTDKSLDGALALANDFIKDRVIVDTQVIADSYNYSVVITYVEEEKKTESKEKKSEVPTTHQKKKEKKE